MAYTDVRFYIAVRPPLEYLLPAWGRAQCRVLLGDDLPCEWQLPAPHQPVGFPDDSAPELRAACVMVCELMDAYLQSIADAWLQTLEDLHAAVQHKLASARAKAAALRAMHAATPEAHARELHRARLQLEEDLRALRAIPLPTSQRPERLVAACDSLRHLFSNAYGSVPTRTLALLRDSFYAELSALQTPIAARFKQAVAARFFPRAHPTSRSARPDA